MSTHELKITNPIDCGNAPKKQVILDVVTAFAKKDLESVDEFLSDELIYRTVGDKQLEGKNKVTETLQGNPTTITEVELLNIITHGHTAAANGIMYTANRTQIEFCQVYRFVSAGKKVIKEITSYVIEN